MKIAALYKRLGFDAPSPLLKQAPTFVLFFVAVLGATTVPGLSISAPSSVAVGVIAVLLATAFAAIISPRESLWNWGLIVPGIDFIAIGLLRDGTGGGSSAFVALVALPVVWFAVEDGRQFVIYAALGTSLTVFMSLFLRPILFDNVEVLARGAYSVVVFGVAAAVINEISRTARRRLDKVRRLADQGRVMLAESVQHAIELKHSETRLRNAERMFREIWVAVTEQAIIGTDLTGLIDAFNPGAEKMLALDVN
ncbi:MAG: PAS domain-containing sensor histidine kinase, partial [Lacisediminihabitans sp.]